MSFLPNANGSMVEMSDLFIVTFPQFQTYKVYLNGFLSCLSPRRTVRYMKITIVVAKIICAMSCVAQELSRLRLLEIHKGDCPAN